MPTEETVQVVFCEPPQSQAGPRDELEVMRVTNSFLFDERAYVSLAKHSRGFSFYALGRISGVILLVCVLLFLPISIICTLGFMDHFADGKVLDSLFWLFFPAMEGLMLFVGVLSILNFHNAPLMPVNLFKMDEVFMALKKGKGLSFSLYKDANQQPRNGKAMKKASRAFKKKLKEGTDFACTPYKVPFSATITNGGIYVGEAQSPFITNFQTEIGSVFESKEYYAISRYDQMVVVFEKNAFRGASRNQVKAFIAAKRGGNNAALSDYANNERLK